jgi:UDP-N-acetylmuramoylalanine--D-glutamate ligase
MGFGVSGRAAVKFLLCQGADVAISDTRLFTALPVEDKEYIQRNRLLFEGGGHSEGFCADCDAVFISPGIPTDIPLLHTLRGKGIPVLGELALATPYLTEIVVAVTGTNGKTTVTALIGELLESAGKEVFVGGNIGTPLLDYIRHGRRADVLVLELSSFQLESAGNFRPHIGVLLNLTPDHLDRHGNMKNYAAAKMKMFEHQIKADKAILCNDDPMCQQVKRLLTHQEKYSFGGLDSGCEAKGAGNSFTITVPGREQESYSLAGTPLESHTGLLNSEASVLAASLLGCGREDIARGLRNFSLAGHRLQFVRKRSGVQYYNDSKATNTGAVLSALASFPGNVILLAGGKEKGEEYTILKDVVQKKVKQLILIGEAADAISTAMGDVVPTHKVVSMGAAVILAAELAEAGDTVLLAPACASFDMFDNYGQRGDVFMQAVQDLPERTLGQAL